MSTRQRISARWVLPIDRPPVAGGWIEIDGGQIVAVESGRPPAGTRDLGEAALLPGLVNAHTHVELSWLAGRIRPAASIVDWIRALLAARAAAASDDPAHVDAMRAAAREMSDTGTVLVGDVTNSLAAVPVLREFGLGGVVLHEVLGFNTADPATIVRDAWTKVKKAVGPPGGGDAPGVMLEAAVVAHAPYPVSPALFAEVARRRRDAPLSVHLAESVEEVEFLRSGRGRFRDLLEELGVWNAQWSAPRCDPAEYLEQVGYLRPGLLAVHGVHLAEQALSRLRAAGATIVTCPRSNAWVGGGLPHVSAFYGSGVPVAVGTDSLASAPSLNLFDELAELRRIAPDVSASSLLESATRVGARALGFGRTFGTIAPGKRARLVGVRVPAGIRDVEEYLVSGVPASSVERLTF